MKPFATKTEALTWFRSQFPARQYIAGCPSVIVHVRQAGKPVRWLIQIDNYRRTIYHEPARPDLQIITYPNLNLMAIVGTQRSR